MDDVEEQMLCQTVGEDLTRLLTSSHEKDACTFLDSFCVEFKWFPSSTSHKKTHTRWTLVAESHKQVSVCVFFFLLHNIRKLHKKIHK